MQIFFNMAEIVPPDFWRFQAKDFITALIALAAFLTASTSVWVAYLRPRKLACELGPVLRLGYGASPSHHLLCRADVVATNVGARPGILTRMTICIGQRNKKLNLYWTEVLKTENIAAKGEPRKLWTDFAGFASLIPVPKYDSRLIEAGFWSDQTVDLLPGIEYDFRLVYWVAGRKRGSYGRKQKLQLSGEAIRFLDMHCTTTERGIRDKHLSLTTTDGRMYSASVPPPKSDERQPEKRDSPQ